MVALLAEDLMEMAYMLTELVLFLVGRVLQGTVLALSLKIHLYTAKHAIIARRTL